MSYGLLGDIAVCRRLIQETGMDMDESKYDKLFSNLDTDQSGDIDQEEFLVWWSTLSRRQREQVLGAGVFDTENVQSDNPVFESGQK